MAMQVVHINQRNVERQCQALGKRGAHMKRSGQTGTACECDSIDILAVDARLTYGLAHDGHDVLLVGTRSQLGHHATVSLMDPLASNDITQQHGIAQYRCRRVVA